MTNMTQAEALQVLIERVKAGDCPPMDEAWEATESHAAITAFNGSLDAAQALHDELLPGWSWTVSGNFAAVMDHDGSDDFRGLRYYEARSENPARAWLIAILEATLADMKSGVA